MKRKKIKAMLSITFGVLGAFLIGLGVDTLGVDTLTFTPITVGFALITTTIWLAGSAIDED